MRRQTGSNSALYRKASCIFEKPNRNRRIQIQQVLRELLETTGRKEWKAMQ
jgi:hypothetical protein